MQRSSPRYSVEQRSFGSTRRRHPLPDADPSRLGPGVQPSSAKVTEQHGRRRGASDDEAKMEMEQP
ncbi:hypothetical protein C8Q78DRAFT_215837 [Trametes maxima]|nr:hypothetical protein C8Q78DRAFT_215837 [Trametes maxima]